MAHPVKDLPLEAMKKAFLDRLWFNMAFRARVPRDANNRILVNENGAIQTSIEYDVIEAQCRMALGEVNRDFNRERSRSLSLPLSLSLSLFLPLSVSLPSPSVQSHSLSVMYNICRDAPCHAGKCIINAVIAGHDIVLHLQHLISCQCEAPRSIQGAGLGRRH